MLSLNVFQQSEWSKMRWAPLGEFTALPQTSSWTRGRENEGKDEDRNGRGEEGGKGIGRGRGKEKGRDVGIGGERDGCGQLLRRSVSV